MGQLPHLSALAVGLILIFVGISTIASGQLFRALREIALNTRKAVVSEEQASKQTSYAALEVFATLNGIVGTLTLLLACVSLYYAIPEGTSGPSLSETRSSASGVKSSKVDPEKVKQAHMQIDLLGIGLRQFYRDTGRYPTVQEGLQSLWECPPGLEKCKGPYLPTPIAPDPWGHPYGYLLNTNTDSFRVLSYGADGYPGGKGEMRMLRSEKYFESYRLVEIRA
jgi:type II secretion system protein G